MDPSKFHQLIRTKLQNFAMTISYTEQYCNQNSFKDKVNMDKFSTVFKKPTFGKDAVMEPSEAEKPEPQQIRRNTTSTCVIEGILSNRKIEDLKQHLKGKILINNLIRIRGDRGPMPLIRLYTKDPTLVGDLITNGITVGFFRYEVEASPSSARLAPCRRYYQYHEIQSCPNRVICFKCGEPHPSPSCSSVPNPKYCATCKNNGHRTDSSICSV